MKNGNMLLALLSLHLISILLISPCSFTLDYSTYLGGLAWDEAYSMAIDNYENIVVVGETHGPVFPTTTGAYDETYNGGEVDGFVMVLTPDLSTLISSTLIGGSEYDTPLDVEVDQDNNIIVTGQTNSANFPVTEGAFDETYNDPFDRDLFVLKMSPTLDTLIASTYVGGNEWETATSLFICQNGEIAVAGQSSSDDFPVTAGSYDTTPEASPCIIFKLTNDLSEMVVGTFINGSDGITFAEDIVEEEDGSLLLTAWTHATDFPTTPGAFDRTLDGIYNIVVFRMSSDLGALLHSTYIGGSGYDYPASLVVDREGNVLVLGDSTSADYPSTSGVYDPTFNPNGTFNYADLVLSKFSHDLSTLLASTFIGSSSSDDYSSSVGIMESGDIIVVGSSFNAGFPTTSDAFDGSFNGFSDVVLSVLTADLSELSYSTFVGGGGKDMARKLVVSQPTGCYVVGYADGGFPTTEGAYDRENNFVDGFLLKFVFPDDITPGLVTGPGPGENNPPLVRTSNTEWHAYGAEKYGVNVACGDLDGNGFDEIITGAGPGAVFGPHVRGWNSNGNPLSNVNFLAYGTNKYGVNVAACDFDGDGIDEILTGAGPGAVFGPHVRGWNVDGGTVTSFGDISYFAYGTLRWGVNVAGGDIDGDGIDEIITGAGPGAVFGPHVRGWDYDGSGPLVSIQAVSYFAYGTLQWGVNVACGDLDGDGIDEIITGPGPGVVFGSHVRGWNYSSGAITPMTTVSYFAYPNALYGVVVAAYDVDGDGVDEILTMPGPDPEQPAHAKAWNVDGEQVTAIEEIDFYPYSDEMRYGGRIAGGHFPMRR